jgi:hypothetical protein
VTPLLYLKLGAIVLALVIIFGAGWTTCKWRYEALQTAQLQAVAVAYQNQVLAREASEAKLQKVQDAYDAIKDIPNPLDTGLAHRVYIAAAGGCPVPATASVAGGAQTSTPIPGGDPSIVGRLQNLIDACRDDAEQMSAMIQLAP